MKSRFLNSARNRHNKSLRKKRRAARANANRGFQFEQLEDRAMLTGLTGEDGSFPIDTSIEAILSDPNLAWPEIAAYTAYLPEGISRDLFLNSGSSGSEPLDGGDGILNPGEGSETDPTDPNNSGGNPLALIISGESEPNNGVATANPIPLGRGGGLDTSVEVNGILSLGDIDVFSFALNAGDIISASVIGATSLSLQDIAGAEMIGSQQNSTSIHPPSSPLQVSGATALSWVIAENGLYHMQVTGAGLGSSSIYTLGLDIYRPVLEQEAVGTSQILFLDFNGATIDTSIFGAPGAATLSPLSAFLPRWGLTAANEDAVIDAIVATMEETLSQDIRSFGNNGDFDVTGNPGDFDIEIRNSRDHADPFGLPNVSRVIVGGTTSELGIGTIGIAESIDVGNFDTTETGVVLLDLLSALPNDPNSLNQYLLDPSVTIIDLIGIGVGNITAHEAGHFFAAWHQNQSNATPSIMDQGGNLNNIIGIGPDGIFGSVDDVDVDFVKDRFVPNEGFTGIEDPLNAIAFGLSSGKLSTSVSGLVFVDKNENGQRDAGEQGATGITIFSDLNGNNFLDLNEPFAVTGAGGAYTMALQPGVQRIREIVPVGSEITFPGSGSHLLNVGVGQNITGINFGNTIAPGEISGFKWNDQNANGIRDFGEPGVQNIVIYVDINNDGRIAIGEPGAITDSNGFYRITGIEPGDYNIREVNLPGWAQTFPIGGGAHQVSISPGAVIENINFGNTVAFDFGDAPAPYLTLRGAGGAVHGFLQGLHLGLVQDFEPDGIPSSDALGDDNDRATDDEDGVFFSTPMVPGFNSAAQVVVRHGPNTPALLQGWVDFNQDGDWNDAGEQIFTDLAVTEGINNIAFSVPAGAQLGSTYARFRYGYERGLSPDGPSLAGEVEDYLVGVSDVDPNAVDDTFDVNENSIDNTLEVRFNDILGISGNPLVITAVGAPNNGGSVVISPDNLTLIYTPDNDFVGIETFSYTISDGIGTDTGLVTINVLSSIIDPQAVDNLYDVPSGTINPTTLDVLDNDIEGNGGAISIMAVGAPDQGGVVVIAPGNLSLEYTPAAGFFGTEQFTYTIEDVSGVTDTAVVTVQVTPNNADDLVSIRLAATDMNGVPISFVTEGDQFQVRAFVDDLRGVANEGVFSAYLDVLYDTSFVSVLSNPLQPDGLGFDITFSPDYSSVRKGDANIPGILDEVGAFQGVGNFPLGASEVLLFSVTFTANTAGVTNFLADPADVLPLHEVAVAQPPASVPISQVRYIESSNLTIFANPGAFSPFTNSRDHLDVNNDGFVSPIDALLVVSDLNTNGSRTLGGSSTSYGSFELPTSYVDVNSDMQISPLDALQVINYLNSVAASGEGETAAMATAESEDPAESESLLNFSPLTTGDSSSLLDSSLSSSQQDLSDAANHFSSPLFDNNSDDEQTSLKADDSLVNSSSVDALLYRSELNGDLSLELTKAANDSLSGEDDLDSILSDLAEDVLTSWADSTSEDKLLNKLNE